MSAQKKTINLLVKEGFEYTTTGHILHWLLTAGRTIVILTELVVIIAFLSRFWLDRMLTDLSEKNNIKRVQVEASKSFESDFRSVQERLDIIKSIQLSNSSPSQIIKTVSSFLPTEVTLTDLVVTKEQQVVIRGISSSESGVAGLIATLQGSKKFKNVVLNDVNLDTKGSQIIRFEIKSDIEKGK